MCHCHFCGKTSRLFFPLDYLVDERAELSSTTELLLDRTHEQALVDLMIPTLLLLINLLHTLRVSVTVLFLMLLSMCTYMLCLSTVSVELLLCVVLDYFSLQETKEQYRNKKLLSALLQLHREVRLCT
jgi:hypothetical protein